MPKRRSTLFATAALGAILATACGQASTGGTPAGRHYTIGILLVAQIAVLDQNVAEFKSTLASEGLIEGRNVTYVEKNANDDLSTVTLLTQQMVQQKPSLIYALGTPLIIALHQETTTIPILFGLMTDPVGSGVAQTATHPGLNLTGTSDYIPAAAYFNFIKQLVPSASTIGIEGNTGEQNTAVSVKDLQQQGATLGLKLQVAPVASTSDILPATASLRGRVNAVIEPADATLGTALKTFCEITLQDHLPVIATTTDAATDGCLVGFGPDYVAMGGTAGMQAAEILKQGKNPGDIPVYYGDQSAKGFQVSINTKTAAALGITVPAALSSTATLVGA